MTKTRSVAATANDNSIPGSRIEDGTIADDKVSNSAEISSEKLSFLQKGVGAQSGRSVQGKLQDVVSVKDFGAKGDGVTGDWGSFRAALTYIKSKYDANEPKPALFIPSGLYRIQFGLPIEFPVEIYGEGPQSSILLTEATSSLFYINLTQPTSSADRVEIRDLRIKGKRENLPNQNGILLNNSGAQNWIQIENCVIEQLGGHGFVATSGVSVSIRIHRTSIYFCRRDAIRLDSGAFTDTRITRCVLRYSRSGLTIGAGANNVYSLWVSDCLIENNTKGAGPLASETANPSAGILNFGTLQRAWIKDCYFEGQLYPILHRGSLFQNIHVDGCYFDPSISQDHGGVSTDVLFIRRPVTLAGSNAQTITITNCSSSNYMVKPSFIGDTQWRTYEVVQTLTGEGFSGSTTLIVSSISNFYPGALISISGLTGYYTVDSVRWAPSGAGPFEVILTTALASNVLPGTTVSLHRGDRHPAWLIAAQSYAENNYGKGPSGTYENPYYLPSNGGGSSSSSYSREPGGTQASYDAKLPERAVIRANNFYSVLCRAGIFSAIRSDASGFYTGVYSSQYSSARSSCASVLSSFNSLSNHDSTLVLSSQAVASASSFKVTGGYGGSPTSGPRSAANRTWEIDSVAGNLTLAGAVTPGATFSDFAEYFENATRGIIKLGTIVTLDGHQVRKALPGEEILGVVSATAAVAAGDTPFSWAQKYMTGEFGEPVYEEIPLESWRPDEGQTEADRPTVKIRKLNSDYDPTLENVPRSERPEEWTCVGLVGQVFVRVDEQVASGDYVTEIGSKAAEKTRLKCMEITAQFKAKSGYAVAKCLLV